MMHRFAKELRPLLLPWIIAAAGALMAPREELVPVLVFFAATVSFALLAASSFGTEFQHRTLPLLLSQPQSRFRIWLEKIELLLLLALALALVNWRVQGFIAFPAQLMLVVATIAGTGLWVRSGRSLVRAILFSFVTQVAIYAAANFFGWTFRISLYALTPELIAAAVLACFIYCGLLVWLGRGFWHDKTVQRAGATAIMGLGLLCFVGQAFAENDPGIEGYVLPAAFILATICSAGFWTFVSRSTIGGAVFTVAAQFLVGSALRLFNRQVNGTTPWFEATELVGITAVTALLYSILFLWLGWKRFARFEVRELTSSDATVLTTPELPVRWWSQWLRCEPHTILRNLVRKELRLLMPLLRIGGVFSACWVAVALLHCLQPHQGYQNLQDVLIGLYVPVTMVLAGCLSLGEEKTLGVTTWHLAFPISIQRQWLIKLTISAVTGILVGIVLPWVLVTIGGAFLSNFSSEILGGNNSAWWQLLYLAALMFVLGFWTSTLSNNTVRAVLLTVVGAIVLIVCASVGSWCARQLGGLEIGIFFFQTVPFVLFQKYIVGSDTYLAGLLWGLSGFVLVALIQSLMQFRQPHAQKSTQLRSALILAFATLLLSFWSTDLMLSVARGPL